MRTRFKECHFCKISKEVFYRCKYKNSREWIYVKDHCKALLKIYLKGRNGQTYNIGTKHNFRNIDLIKKIISIAKNYELVNLAHEEILYKNN